MLQRRHSCAYSQRNGTDWKYQGRRHGGNSPWRRWSLCDALAPCWPGPETVRANKGPRRVPNGRRGYLGHAGSHVLWNRYRVVDRCCKRNDLTFAPGIERQDGETSTSTEGFSAARLIRREQRCCCLRPIGPRVRSILCRKGWLACFRVQRLQRSYNTGPTSLGWSTTFYLPW